MIPTLFKQQEELTHGDHLQTKAESIRAPETLPPPNMLMPLQQQTPTATAVVLAVVAATTKEVDDYRRSIVGTSSRAAMARLSKRSGD